MHKRTKRLVALLVALAMLLSVTGSALAADCPTYQQAYEGIIALQEKYPEGTPWTNFVPYSGDGYIWKGGRILGYIDRGTGCAAFTFEASDEVFGDLPSRTYMKGGFTFDDIRVGDILRLYNNGHSVIVLQKSAGGVIVAEGNYNGTVHWGRAMSEAETMGADYLITRYPEGFVPSDDAEADVIVKSGTEGNLSWTLTKAGTLTISGNGAMPDFTAESSPSWNVPDSYVSTIVIEDGITSVGDYAFSQSKALSVFIPSGVTEIGQRAFSEAALLAVTIPGTVTTVSDDAFRGCQNLTSVTTNEGLQIIGERAFYGCTSLTHIDFPASVTSIGSGAFVSCSSLVSVRFIPGDTEVKMGDDIFTQCWRLSTLTLPQNLTNIPSGTFSSCKLLNTLYIPASVKNLGTAEDGSGDGPFKSSGLLTIYFGGSQADWNSMTNAVINGTLQQMGTQVIYDAEFDNPFAVDPNDPGDLPNITPPEEDPCKDGHVGTADENGNCSECGKPMNTGSPVEHEHKWSTDWSHNETHHWHECTADGCTVTNNSEKNGYGEHGYGDWAINTNATATQSGSRHRSCEVCSYRQTESIPATGGNTGGSTGGSSGGSGTIPSSTPRPTNTPTPTNTPKPSTTPPPVTPKPSDAPVKNPDGSITTTVIDESTGTKTETTQKTDGSSITAMTYRNGLTVTTTADASGNTAHAVQVPADVTELAEELGAAVYLPVPEVKIAKNVASATPITVDTGVDKSTRVAIPVNNPTTSTVAMAVKADGSTEIIKAAAATDRSMIIPMESGVTVKIVDNHKDFSDTSAKSWYGNAVDFVSARNLFAGTSATTFAPNSPMTRAMLMTVLARFDDAETTGGSTWYAKSVEWAAKRGISDGTNPASNITREQLVTMLWRYMGSPKATDSLVQYTDAGQISSYAQDAIRWAVENKLVSGYGDGRLGPKEQATRAQVAQVLKNLIENMTLN